MASVRRTVTLPLAFVVCVLVATGVVASPGVAVGESLTVITAPQDPAAGEASLALDRPTRGLIQQGLRNEGFDPGTPDGLFGPRTRAAIPEWQQSRGASPTGYLNGAEAELLRTATAPPAAAPEAPPALEVVPAAAPTASSAAAAPASTPTETDPSPPSPATLAAEEVDPQNAAETNTQQRPRARGADGTVQLPPEILVGRHLLRAERFLAECGRDASIRHAVTGHQQGLGAGHHAVRRGCTVRPFRQRVPICVAEYLAAVGREGEFYRDALELLDSAKVRLEREAAERRRVEAARRRAEAQRRRAARWPSGHVFRDCETCPEMVVLPGSAVALDRYELTVGEYRAFASATGGGQPNPCYNVFSDRVRNSGGNDPGVGAVLAVLPESVCVAWGRYEVTVDE